MKNIKFNFVNQSADTNKYSVVVFQKLNPGGTPIAWEVIKNAGNGWHHPFIYDINLAIEVQDDHGNVSPLTPALPGEKWILRDGDTGHELVPGDAGSGRDIYLVNELGEPGFANVFRSGKKVAAVFLVPGGGQAMVRFDPVICIAVCENEIKEGDYIEQELMYEVQLPVLGMASADIIMTGGVGEPFVFTLANKKIS